MNGVDTTLPVYTTGRGGFTNVASEGNVPVPDGVSSFWSSIAALFEAQPDE